MGDWKMRLAVAIGLSLLLLPLGLMLKPNLTTPQLLGLLLVGSLTSGLVFTFRLFLFGSGLCAALMVVWLVGPLAPWLTSRLITAEPPKPADLVVILGGGMSCGTGHLEASSLGRLVKGLELWKQGYAPRITLTDTDGRIFGDPNCPSVATQANKLVQALFAGKPEVILLQKMRTTRTEALAVAQVAKQRGFKRVLVVTAPTHTRRACATFRQLGLEVVCVAALEPRYDITLRNPWDRWMALSSVVREYLGLLSYGWRGWL
jgi:uncharacterized SAM-binding protein YcdF (DUF218 family)